jgi:hypothetical protein
MEKIIFFNTGWMDFYQGISQDKIIGGGEHVETHGWGGEMLNFKIFRNRHYGYVQVGGNIKLDRLGAKPMESKLENVLVVWTAREPKNGGTYIVGWYKNATVFRQYQFAPKSSKRKWLEDEIGYFATAKTEDCKLLPKDERVVKVPRGSQGMGQRNIWYGDNNPDFIKLVQNYINNGVLPAKPSTRKIKSSPKQIDPLKRVEIETKAVQIVVDYYKQLGYDVTSFEKDNIGWDLTAINDSSELKLEVKGLSGSEAIAELTPNEYKSLKSNKHDYRLCIVTEVLTKPQLRIFAHSNETNQWSSEDGTSVEFNEIISARVSAN